VDLWRIAPFRAGNLVSALFGAALYAWLLVSVIYLVEVWRYSELAAGLAMTHGGVFAATVGIVVGRSSRRFSPRGLIVTGALFMAATTGALALWLPADAHFVTVWLPIGLSGGVGIGAVSVGVSSVATLSVPPTRFAAATGLTMAARQVGGAVGVAVLAVLLDSGSSDIVVPFRHVYLFAAVCSAAAAVVALAGMRPAPVGTAAPSSPQMPAQRVPTARPAPFPAPTPEPAGPGPAGVGPAGPGPAAGLGSAAGPSPAR
jgi:MFS family permease